MLKRNLASSIVLCVLQRESIDRELRILPFKEANTDKIWLLKKCLYRFADASKEWHNTVKQVLLSLGFKMSKVDPSLFYYQNNSKLEGIITMHVNDFLSAGNEYFFKNIIFKICKKFPVRKEYITSFHHLGLDLKVHKNCISLDQTHYIKSLDPVNLKDEYLCIHNILQSKIGKLIWISGQTRTNIYFNVCHPAINLQNSTSADIKHFNKVISHIKQPNISLTFQYLGEFQN